MVLGVLSQLKQKEESLNEKISTFKDEMNALHERSKTEFKVLASSVFDEKRKAFVDENKKEMNTIFDPLKSDLQLFKEKIEATRKEDIQDMTSLKSEIENLQKLNVQLSDDAKNLATALKSEVKVQGNWGEDRLLNILESEGLVKYIDFDKESSHRDDEQERLRRPDFILKLPNGKSLIIDCKVSLTAYVNYFNATTPKEKEEVVVEVEVDDSSKVADLISKVFPTLPSKIIDLKKISIKMQKSDLNQLHKALVSNGMNVYNFTTRNKLEDFFLKLTHENEQPVFHS